MDHSLSLKIFYPDAISSDEVDGYNDAFAFWYRIWLETRSEVDDSLATPSDSFSRQSEILVLHHDGRPVATCCHRYVDLRHHCVIHDSYFASAIWPDSVKAMVPSLGRSCVLGSHLFVDPEFRKGRSELPIKNLVGALYLAHLDGTKPDVLLGMTRVDRGVHRLFHDSGAVSLYSEVRWYQIPVDLIALFPSQIPIRIDPRYQEAVAAIGATCERFTANYFERHRLRDRRYVNGAKDAAGAPGSFGQAG